MVKQALDKRWVRYILVGGSAYITEIACLYMLHYVFNISSVISVALSFWVGLFLAFGLQKFITFQNHEKQIHHIRRQAILYAVLVLWNYIFTLACTQLLSGRMSVIAIRTMTVIIITAWNYLAYKVIFTSKLET